MQFQAAERRVTTPRDNSSFYCLNPDTADFAPGSLYSVRHTVTRWMRRNGVPTWEVAAAGPQVARLPHDRTLCRLVPPICRTPSAPLICCSGSFAPVDEPFFRAVRRQRIEIDRQFGAGEGIRTPDPNLGK